MERKDLKRIDEYILVPTGCGVRGDRDRKQESISQFYIRFSTLNSFLSTFALSAIVFGGTMEKRKILDEESVKRLLTEWLEAFGGCRVLWEKKNSINKPIFAVKHGTLKTNEKPDILIITNDEKYYLCEVKDGRKKSNVYDSFPQILKYASGNFEYSIKGKVIKPDGFLVATQESTRGHLFSSICDAKIEHLSDGRKCAIERGELPQEEYCMTEEYTRLLWRMSENIGIDDLKIGVLLCNIDRIPMFQYKIGKQQGVEQWKK